MVTVNGYPIECQDPIEKGQFIFHLGDATDQLALVVKNCLPMQETEEIQFRSLGGGDPLEKEMATHSSILAWEILWTEEPGRLQSVGSQRVGHN